MSSLGGDGEITCGWGDLDMKPANGELTSLSGEGEIMWAMEHLGLIVFDCH